MAKEGMCGADRLRKSSVGEECAMVGQEIKLERLVQDLGMYPKRKQRVSDLPMVTQPGSESRDSHPGPLIHILRQQLAPALLVPQG